MSSSSPGVQIPRRRERRLGGRAGGLEPPVLRIMDIAFSLMGLIVAAPLFPVIAVLIKLDSKGPVFFPTERVGKDQKPFQMYKFRTMLDMSVKIDQSVCPQYDPRVTRAGRFLRRTKLNELPQLFNVLRGDMSFVGPRPEAPDLAEMYPEDAKRIFLVKPGLVGPAVISSFKDNIRGRNEEELYPTGVDPKKFYIEQILPQKVKVDLYYLSRQTVRSYFQIILLALKETVFGALNARNANHNKRGIYLLLTDLGLSQISYTLAWFLFIRVAGPLARPSLKSFLGGLLLVLVVRMFVQYMFGLYNLVMELITPRDFLRLLWAVGTGGLLIVAAASLAGPFAYPLEVAVIDIISLSVLLSSVRFFMLFIFRQPREATTAERRPQALIYGANRNGLRALYALGRSKNSPYKIVGFIDDAAEKFAKTINGIKILGNRHHIQALSVLHDIQEMILAPEREARGIIHEIIPHCLKAGIRPRLLSLEERADEEEASSFPLRPVGLSDVLPSVDVLLDKRALHAILDDRTVLMLGSGGQLGSALCRSLFHGGCRKLVIVDRTESGLFEILPELRSDLPGFHIVPVVLDCQDIGRLDELFIRHKPRIVIHAGMRKFVNNGDIDYDEVARANYFRTFNLAKIASAHGCEQFLVISSIKATARGNFVSDSLRVAEISLSAFFDQTRTNLIIMRVGNIIENRGGVVSWLNGQIVEQRKLLLPPENAKVYLLSKNAAARAILQALVTGAKITPGGSLLTSEPGALLDIADVARRIANLYGLKPDEDITCNFGEIPGSLIADKPLTDREKSRRCADFDSVWKFPMVEKLITGKAVKMSGQDMDRETREIITWNDAPHTLSMVMADSN